MYESFYGLREKPFSILPDPDLIYWGRAHRMALAMLEFGVLNSAGFTVITGEIGSGKTTLLRYALRRLNPRSVNVGLISNTPQTREELLQYILHSLHQPFEGSIATLLSNIQNYLATEYRQGKRTIIIVDEAQNLREDALETLRMMSNINVDKHQLLQLILVGQPQLKEMLCRPQFVQFAQRVSSDFHLKPLGPSEVTEYIHFRLGAVGASTRIFSHEAGQLVAQASGGIPRVINILCDTALVYGFSLQLAQIDAKVVQEVIDDKQNYGIFPLPQRLERVDAID